MLYTMPSRAPDGVPVSIDSAFCVDALEEAIAKSGFPEIFNTDQGSQFTAETFTEALRSRGIAISMDGKGRWMDNVFYRKTLKKRQV